MESEKHKRVLQDKQIASMTQSFEPVLNPDIFYLFYIISNLKLCYDIVAEALMPRVRGQRESPRGRRLANHVATN